MRFNLPALMLHMPHNAPLYVTVLSKQQRRIAPEFHIKKKSETGKGDNRETIWWQNIIVKMSSKSNRKLTFSTTDVSLKVKYSPVNSDENRLPYSLFKKKRYQTGVGNKARYSSSKYSTKVSIWPWRNCGF